MKDGIYSFRFTGFDVTSIGIGYLVGLGKLTLLSNKIVDGHEWSAATLLSRRYDQLLPATFTLHGKFAEKRNGRIWGDVRFVQTGKLPRGMTKPEILDGTFNLVASGQETFWMISSYTRSEPSREANADEIISGEMIWTKPAKRTIKPRRRA